MTPETLAAYFDAGHPAKQQLTKEPLYVLDIDPSRRELTLRTPTTGSDIGVPAYRIIRTGIVGESRDETVWFRVTVETKDIECEVYSLLQAVTDQLQQGDDLERALHVALDAFRGLLTRAPKLSEDQEIGLFSGLVALGWLIGGVRKVETLTAWLGPWTKEHDFALGEADVEVETTRSEWRIHVIHGLGQPTPTPGRLLHLVSVQITGAGAAGSGETLPELIERIRRRLRSGHTDFDDRLAGCGWKDARADRLYATRLLVRSEPRFYTVDEAFPAIISTGLSWIVARPELVRSIDYRIDVTDLRPKGTAPAEFAAAPTHEDWDISIDKYDQALKQALGGMNVPMDLHGIVSAYLQAVGGVIAREEVPDPILSTERNASGRAEFHFRLSEWDAEKDAAWTNETVTCTPERRVAVMK